MRHWPKCLIIAVVCKEILRHNVLSGALRKTRPVGFGWSVCLKCWNLWGGSRWRWQVLMKARQSRHTRRVLSRLLLLGLLFHTSFSLWLLGDLPLPKIALLYRGVDGAISQFRSSFHTRSFISWAQRSWSWVSGKRLPWTCRMDLFERRFSYRFLPFSTKCSGSALQKWKHVRFMDIIN